MIPVFGNELDKDFKQRKASYAVILEKSRMATVQDLNYRFFLPGGGIEGSENAEHAVLREIFEECGRNAKICVFIGEAIQYFTSSNDIFYKMNVCFFHCSFTSDVVAEADHLVSWENPK